jgi:hypothetical protein
MTGTDGSLHGASKLGLAALPGRLFAFLGQPPPFSQLPEPRGPVDPTLRCSASALPGRESDPDTRGWLVVQWQQVRQTRGVATAIASDVPASQRDNMS